MALPISYRQAIESLYNGKQGEGVRYATWPALTGTGTPGVKATSGAGAWGALVDIVAAAAIKTAFKIWGICYRGASGAQVFEIELENAAAGVLWNGFTDIVATEGVPHFLPQPIAMAANAKVKAKVGGAAAKDLFLAIMYSVTV